MNWGTIGIAAAVLGSLGLVLGALLALASKVLAVETDPRLELLVEALPGANCGGCGFAGCSTYANAILSGEAGPAACPVGGQATADKICEIMEIQTTKNTRMTALVHCSGGVRASRKYNYEGLTDCTAAMRIGGGPLECAYGCLGLGSCMQGCPFGAISMVDGVAMVDHEKCTGCLKCVRTCPKGVIRAVPYTADVVVACSSHEKGGLLRKVCEIGCLGCRICERVCQHDAIHVEDNLAVIDTDKCVGCGDCAEKCPRHLIIDANLERGPRALDEVM